MWSKAYTWGWVAIVLGLLFYEFWAGWGTGKHTPMLTQVTVRYCPWWVTMPFLTWLWLHFLLRYVSHSYRANLGTGHQVGMPF